jgi:3-dehydroquinate dehydratase-1/3-dehydroquinate dehydratase/shikimate dehydrogenase
MTGRNGLICVSVLADTAIDVIDAVQSVAAMVDVVEIRMDGMKDHHVERCITGLAKPVLVTNRPDWEGGLFTGSESERIEVLCQAIRSGARYVDIELRTEPALRGQVQLVAQQFGAKVIVSSHDFHKTPSVENLQATLREMIASGADIGKIVTTAAHELDTLRILALQQEALAVQFPLSAFAMGTPGKISRLATLYLGGCMTYAALSQEQATAPGQLSIHDLHALISLFERNA